MIYLKLFWSFFQIGLFSIGGGYASLPLIENQAVHANGWLTLTQFTDLITISQMTPGPIAVNAATFVGIQIAGPGGALAATFGCLLPSCVIVFTFAFLYSRYKKLAVMQGLLTGLRPTVAAMIASAGLSMVVLSFWGEKNATFGILDTDFPAVILFAAASFFLRKCKTGPVRVIVVSGIAGIVVYLAGYWNP